LRTGDLYLAFFAVEIDSDVKFFYDLFYRFARLSDDIDDLARINAKKL